jgi:hypothetical protein
VKLKRCDKLLHLILGKHPNISLGQIGTAVLEGYIFIDQTLKRPQHPGLRFPHCFQSPEADTSR